MKRHLGDYELPYNIYFLKKQFFLSGVIFNFLILICDVCMFFITYF
jgi:hypothetical protein